jgi:raffinose/stachyose/melibiose transport system substrate-binding protein
MTSSMSRRYFIANGGKMTIAAGLAGGWLAACSRLSGEDSGGGDVSFWTAVENSQQRKYFIEHTFNAFENDHKDIDLQVSFKSIEDLDRLVQTALQTGEGPDVVSTPGPSFAVPYIDANLLLPLDEYTEQYNWEDKILPWALEAGKLDGELYSLPSSYETLVTFYNRTLFEEKGWKPPTTRDELESLADEAQGQGILPFIAGNAEWRPATEWFVTIFWNHYAGPEALAQALAGKLSWTDPVFVDATSLMNDYFQRGWFGGSVEQYFSNRFDPLYAMLGDGKAAMNMEGTWFDINVEDFFGKGSGNSNEWDWAPNPSLSDDVAYPLFELGIGGTLSINARSKGQDEAATYLDWFFSDPERIAKGVADINAQPLPVPFEPEDFPSNIDPRIKDQMISLSKATSQGNFGYTTWTFWPPASDTYIYEEMEKVLTGDITPAEYTAGLDEVFKKELKEGKVPPIIDPDKV